MAIANLRKVAACSVRYFLPGTIWFPVTTRYYPPRPMRLRTAAESVPKEKYKSELKAGVWHRGGTRRQLKEVELSVAASVLPRSFVDRLRPRLGYFFYEKRAATVP